VQAAFEEFTSGLTRRYLCLDRVHMTEPFHRFMALRFLSHLAGGEVETPSTEGGRIALTFDDAPMPDGAVFTGSERTMRLITALKEAGVPSALFFVNTANIPAASGAARLASYAEAGHTIGNHTHNHVNASEVPVADFIASVTTAHGLLRALPGFTPFFRYPYSKEGADAGAQTQIRAAIAALGYSEGYFTADSADWYWNSLLEGAVRGGRNDLRDTIVDLYVKATWDSIKHYALLAHRVLQGQPPIHVLILHETDLNALALPALARLLKSHGWSFATPAEAYGSPLATQVPRGLSTQDRLRGLAEDQGLSGDLAAPLTDTTRIDELAVNYGVTEP
jgi:peptidoglycan/xylan/chitin deacetylase (PgdA/CDA1 family)